MDNISKRTESVQSFEDERIGHETGESVDPPTDKGIIEEDCAHIEFLEADIFEEKKSETLQTSTPKRRPKSPKPKNAKTRNVVRTIFSKTEVDCFSPGKRKIYEEVNRQRKDNQNLRKKVKRYDFSSSINVLSCLNFQTKYSM